MYNLPNAWSAAVSILVLVLFVLLRVYYSSGIPSNGFKPNQVVDVIAGPTRDFSGVIVSGRYQYHARSRTLFSHEWVYTVQIGSDFIEVLESELKAE